LPFSTSFQSLKHFFVNLKEYPTSNENVKRFDLFTKILSSLSFRLSLTSSSTSGLTSSTFSTAAAAVTAFEADDEDEDAADELPMQVYFSSHLVPDTNWLIIFSCCFLGGSIPTT
jgi:hypothetical protein